MKETGAMSSIDPVSMLRPQRKIKGISAILLPLLSDDSIDWEGFESHVQRTLDAGLVPAVNMDTGYGNLIDPADRLQVIKRTQELSEGREFVAGAFVQDKPGQSLDLESYLQEIDRIVGSCGIPVIVQSHGLIELPEEEVVKTYQAIGQRCDHFYAFELDPVFAPFGQIYSLEIYQALMGIPSCLGAKHSSLNRLLEWERLQLRDLHRPDFRVCTGNDLAIDMVMYGSDYLLGLSTFAPEAFALRDSMWQAGDPRFYELNDLLQYLGTFSFRPPVSAYKHSAAMFLHLREQIESPKTHPDALRRPDTDLPILQKISDQLTTWLEGE